MTGSPTIRPCAADDLPSLQRIRAAAFAPVFRSFREIVGPVKSAADPSPRPGGERSDRGAQRIDPGVGGPPCQLGTMALSSNRFPSSEPEQRGQSPLTRPQQAAVDLSPPGRGERSCADSFTRSDAGAGIGSWMYAAALGEMQSLGALVATVGAGGDPSDAAARRGYEKAGCGPGIPSVLYRLLSPGPG